MEGFHEYICRMLRIMMMIVSFNFVWNFGFCFVRYFIWDSEFDFIIFRLIYKCSQFKISFIIGHSINVK